MSADSLPFQRQDRVLLAGLYLLQALLAVAAEPAGGDSGYGKKDADDLCLLWDKIPAVPRIRGNKIHLGGHFYYRKGGCDPAPGARQPLADQTLRIHYQDQGESPRELRPESVTTDSKGDFRLALPAPASDGGVEVIAAWYGKTDASAEPLALARQKLMTHLVLEAVGSRGRLLDPDKNPAGPEGSYRLRARLVSWNGKELKPYFPLSLVKAERPADSVANHGFAVPVAEKPIEIEGFTVKGIEKTPGAATVKALTGQRESRLVTLPFGAWAKLERIDSQAQQEEAQEILLQRPAGYNADQGYDTEFFMEEHACLELRLSSLISGNPLPGRHVRWRLADPVPAGITAVLATHTGAKPRSSTVTDQNGSVRVPVSARHSAKDRAGRGGGPPASRAYEVAAGNVCVQAQFQGQVESVKVPFIDSLWLKAHCEEGAGIAQEWTEGDIREVRMRVDGYVGTDGKSLAKRPFHEWDARDHSVTGSKMAEPFFSGPIYFSDKNDAVTPSNKAGAAAELTRAGLALRPGAGKPKNQLTGYFRARKRAEHFCLVQHWDNKAAGTEGVWWNQSGVTLQVPDLCGTVKAKKSAETSSEADHNGEGKQAGTTTHHGAARRAP